MKITFLGTGSMVPTDNRNHTSILFSYKNENILVDCGEGTQRQLRLAKISTAKITKILITHWHGDHVLGLPGLLQSMYKNQYHGSLEVYGPRGTRDFFNKMLKWFYVDLRMNIIVKEIKNEIFFENQDFILKSAELNHGVPCVGYSFIEKERKNINKKYLKKFNLKNNPIIAKLKEGKDITWNGKKIKSKNAVMFNKGKKISFILDTGLTNNIIKLCKESDLLICESTHSHELKGKAKEYKHLTAKQAGLIAKKSRSKELILTHFSQRYKDINNLLKEAKDVFKNAKAADDFKEFEV
ncbi:ribonuclease Z [Candidatus Woesearchaeota archaeon]|nr:ribonuclease Z [Candidatus Woesearchaeota archaeon]